ncbi:MAG: hypothetical protein MN733_37035, partial [Nitrososphaera sp.]|nr:hypothetical protein [Nitrososphaera sp.]
SDFTPSSGSTLNAHAISSLQNVAANKTENYSTLCGLTTFSSHFLSAMEANYNVLCAFQIGWGLKSGDPEINSDMIGSFETDATIETFGNITSASILGYKRSPTQLAAGAREVLGSIVGSPVLGPERTVFVALDNPNKYPIRGVTLLVEPPQTTSQPDQPNLSMQPDQCFMLQPVDSSSLWKAEVDVFKNKGLYRGSVFVEYEAPGRLGVATAFFERFRYDTTTVEDIPPKPGVNKDFNINFGVDLNSTSSVSKGTGSVGVTLFNYGESGASGVVAFPMISASGDLDRQWIALSPGALNIGNLMGGRILSNIWLHGGMGYVFHDKATPSTKGDFIIVGGVRISFLAQ